MGAIVHDFDQVAIGEWIQGEVGAAGACEGAPAAYGVVWCMAQRGCCVSGG